MGKPNKFLGSEYSTEIVIEPPKLSATFVGETIIDADHIIIMHDVIGKFRNKRVRITIDIEELDTGE